MKRALPLLIALAVPLAACSVFNKPDRGRLDGGARDAWIPDDDVGLDGGPDGGPDAGDAWSCPGGQLHEQTCGNGLDDDCDGVVDCGDSDCITAGALECCRSGTTDIEETFELGTSGSWEHAGWSAPASISTAVASGAFSRLGASPGLSMVLRECLEVDLGLQVRFAMQASACTNDCDGHLEVVLGPSATFAGALVDDLAIRGTSDHGDLVLEVVQGGTVRTRSSTHFGSNVTTVVIDLAPGLAEGMPAIVANVLVNGTERLAENLYVTDRDIFGTSGCNGLHFGVQGYGGHVALDDLVVGQRDCSNPARFVPPSADGRAIDAVTTSVSSSTMPTTGWGRGGIGDPALFQIERGTDAHFVLLFDASTVDRASDVIGHLPLSIGGVESEPRGTPLLLADTCGGWRPRSYELDVPAPCTAPLAAAAHSVVESTRPMRDPTIYPDGRAATGVGGFRMAWVGEPAGSTDTSLYTGLLDADPEGRIGSVGSALTIEGESCTSIRNPLILPLYSDDVDWLLLYVCDTFPSEVHAARMNHLGSMATRYADVVIGPTQLGVTGGVTDIAGVVFDYGTAGTHLYTYRLWLTVRPTTATTAVMFVEGVIPRDAAEGTPPAFVPFAGNPVLSPTSPAFRDACNLGCQLRGITATRMVDAPTRVRLLVERWVDTGAGLTYSLVPLEQVYPSDE